MVKTIQTRQPAAATTAANSRRMPRPPTLFLDQLLPAAEIAVSDGAVQVDDAFLEALEQLEVQGAIVDHIAHFHADSGPDERQDVGKRIHDAIDTPADPVADRHRLQEGHDEVGAGAHAPDPQRLPEVFSALLESPVFGRVEEAADAGRAVDQETGELAARSAPLALQQAVDHTRHEVDVFETVRDHDLEGLGHDQAVDLRDRLQDVPVGPPVELEHLLVESLPRVVVLVVARRARGLDLFLGCALGLGDHRRVRAAIAIATVSAATAPRGPPVRSRCKTTNPSLSKPVARGGAGTLVSHVLYSRISTLVRQNFRIGEKGNSAGTYCIDGAPGVSWSSTW